MKDAAVTTISDKNENSTNNDDKKLGVVQGTGAPDTSAHESTTQTQTSHAPSTNPRQEERRKIDIWGPVLPLPSYIEYHPPTKSLTPDSTSSLDAYKDYTYGFLPSSTRGTIELFADEDFHNTGHSAKM